MKTAGDADARVLAGKKPAAALLIDALLPANNLYLLATGTPTPGDLVIERAWMS